MDLGIKGKVALVAAGSRGIGRACALALAREGAHVAICARNADSLREVAEEIRSANGEAPLTQQADLSDASSIAAFVAAVEVKLGSVSIAVANSLGPKPGNFEQFDDADWEKSFNGAVLSTVRLVRAVLPGMRARRAGAIVAIQSTSVKQPIPGLILSNGVRPGVAGLMKSLAAEYGKDNIRFNVVCPGRILTERFMAVEGSHGEAIEQRLAEKAAEIPLRRFGEPTEVADAVAFLASERAAYITGTVLQVDGGNVRGLL